MRGFLKGVALGAAAWALIGAGAASAAVVASYDGTYTPTSVSPPGGQTTWSTDLIGSVSITPNYTAGVARVLDNNDTSRVAIYTVLNPSSLAATAWSYQITIRFDSQSQTALPRPTLLFGMRDEGASGRTVMLGLDPTTGQIGFYNNSQARQSATFGVDTTNTTNYVDSTFHTYLVTKSQVGANYFVQVSIDGVDQFASPIAYTSLPGQSSTTQGFGLFSSTTGTLDYQLDQMTLQTIAVPEPAGIALLGLGGLALRARRTRA